MREPSDLTHLGADLDVRPDHSDGAIWTACWSEQAARRRARYRSPSRCCGSGRSATFGSSSRVTSGYRVLLKAEQVSHVVQDQ